MHKTSTRTLAALLLVASLHAWAGAQTTRLTNNSVRKPCVTVSADGSRLAWIEQHENPAPENTVYLVRTTSTSTPTTPEDLMVLPAISSNLKTRVTGTDSPLVGPHFNPSDLNYRVMGVFPVLRLSRDGNLLVVSVVEVFQTIIRHPFFVVFDLKNGSHRITGIEIPESMGLAVRENPTVEFNPMHWDLNPAGTHIAYVLNTTNSRNSASAVMLMDLTTGQARRIMGYNSVSIANSDWVIEGPSDQRILYGNRLTCGDDSLVITGRDSQGQDGIWIAPLDVNPPTWITAAFATPGIVQGHAYYRGQDLAAWLGSGGTVDTRFPQNADLDNSGSIPFWTGSPAAYVLDRERRNLLRLAGDLPQMVHAASDFGLPDQWRFRLCPNSNDESFRLASETGDTVLLPAESPGGKEMDLFLATFELAAGGAGVVSDANTAEFESQVDGFKVESLLRPGELTPRWMSSPNPGRPSTGQTTTAEPNSPQVILPEAWTDPAIPELPITSNTHLPESAGETAENAYAQASLLMMQGPLTARRLAQVIERLESAVRSDDGNHLYHLDLARAYLMAGTTLSISAAIEEFSLLLRRDSKDDEALGGLADAYAELGDLELAMQLVFLRPIQNPGKEEILHSAGLQMAVLALDSGDLAGGLTYLRELHGQHPQDRFLEGLIGLVWQLQGDAERAEAVFQKIIDESPPDDPIARIAVQIRDSMKSEGGAR